MEQLATLAFWKDMGERAISTAIQAFLAASGVLAMATGVFDAAAILHGFAVAAGAGIVSALKCAAAHITTGTCSATGPDLSDLEPSLY